MSVGPKNPNTPNTTGSSYTPIPDTQDSNTSGLNPPESIEKQIGNLKQNPENPTLEGRVITPNSGDNLLRSVVNFLLKNSIPIENSEVSQEGIASTLVDLQQTITTPSKDLIQWAESLTDFLGSKIPGFQARIDKAKIELDKLKPDDFKAWEYKGFDWKVKTEEISKSKSPSETKEIFEKLDQWRGEANKIVNDLTKICYSELFNKNNGTEKTLDFNDFGNIDTLSDVDIGLNFTVEKSGEIQLVTLIRLISYGIAIKIDQEIPETKKDTCIYIPHTGYLVKELEAKYLGTEQSDSYKSGKFLNEFQMVLIQLMESTKGDLDKFNTFFAIHIAGMKDAGFTKEQIALIKEIRDDVVNWHQSIDLEIKKEMLLAQIISNKEKSSHKDDNEIIQEYIQKEIADLSEKEKKTIEEQLKENPSYLFDFLIKRDFKLKDTEYENAYIRAKFLHQTKTLPIIALAADEEFRKLEELQSKQASPEEIEKQVLRVYFYYAMINASQAEATYTAGECDTTLTETQQNLTHQQKATTSLPKRKRRLSQKKPVLKRQNSKKWLNLELDNQTKQYLDTHRGEKAGPLSLLTSALENTSQSVSKLPADGSDSKLALKKMGKYLSRNYTSLGKLSSYLLKLKTIQLNQTEREELIKIGRKTKIAAALEQLKRGYKIPPDTSATIIAVFFSEKAQEILRETWNDHKILEQNIIKSIKDILSPSPETENYQLLSEEKKEQKIKEDIISIIESLSIADESKEDLKTLLESEHFKYLVQLSLKDQIDKKDIRDFIFEEIRKEIEKIGTPEDILKTQIEDSWKMAHFLLPDLTKAIERPSLNSFWKDVL